MEQLTYADFINHILETRGRFSCGEQYHERHHIYPRCLGGTNEKENLIDLFGREHLIAHKLLAQENPDNLSLTRAYAIMGTVSNEYHQRYMFSPEEYEMVRSILSSQLKEYYSDPTNHPCYGKKASTEARKKMSEKAKKRLSDPTKNPMYGKRGEDNPNFGQKRSKEFCENLSMKMKERMRTLEFSGANNPRAKKVIRLSDGKIYACGKEAALENGIIYSSFKAKCQHHRGFMYYDEYIASQISLEEKR